MINNRSMPTDVIIPVLAYPSVSEAVDWLQEAFGFRLRWRIADHRAQLGVNETSAVAITEGSLISTGADHVMIRVESVDQHRQRASAAGARVSEPADHPYGERQYTATDFAGRHWVFSESTADVTPEAWGAASAT